MWARDAAIGPPTVSRPVRCLLGGVVIADVAVGGPAGWTAGGP